MAKASESLAAPKYNAASSAACPQWARLRGSNA
jgi:hypothetical protein